MERLRNALSLTDRASPRNDAQTHRPKSANSMLGLPSQGRARLTTLVPYRNLKVRFATLNVGTLTGKTKELASLFKRRRVDFICLQETRWTGSKARNIGEGYKLMYVGAKHGRNGVAIAVKEDHLENILEVNRINDRLMSIKVLVEGEVLNIVAAYAPQVGCSQAEKDNFWTSLEYILQLISPKETTLLGGDLNGHIGEANSAFKRVHGGYAYGTLNDAGKVILSTAAAFDLAIANSFFAKKIEHLITYKSGQTSSQIDYILINRAHIGRVTNCKEKPTQIPELTKWWNLKGEKIPEFCERLADLKVDVKSDIDTIWEHLPWHHYYEQLLSLPHLAATQLPGLEVNAGLIPPIHPDEVKKALHKMSNKKAIGPDGIPVEAWKCLGLRGLVLLTDFFNCMLFSSKMPKAWRLSTIVPIYKGKGSKYECNNYRGIKLLSHTMKLYERVIDSRIRSECELSKNHYGFVPGLSTTDPMFALNTIVEEYRAKNRPLYV
ncbi:unnamed protein product [Parnassius apollo]|uniref:(apollo) hypothetical protein n=1 Tax=Parnassius apollo TaxID=110799 RepID=A0A8S3W234_PARAO|nr:unnamed protein product [Parnassius apollo]